MICKWLKNFFKDDSKRVKGVPSKDFYEPLDGVVDLEVSPSEEAHIVAEHDVENVVAVESVTIAHGSDKILAIDLAKVTTKPDLESMTKEEIESFERILKNSELIEQVELPKDTVNDGDHRHPDFSYLWDNLILDPQRMTQIEDTCRMIIDNKHRYSEVADEIAVRHYQHYGEIHGVIPWWFIAALHYRESSLDFRGVLHNGQRIIGTGLKTTWVPKGRGPFETWETAAMDALINVKNFHKHKNWNIIDCIIKAEKYNGLGYRYRINEFGKKEYSPYLFAGTNMHDETGKYTSDGEYNAMAPEKQLGVCALWRGLEQIFGEDIK